jgi:hypothetical protein
MAKFLDDLVAVAAPARAAPAAKGGMTDGEAAAIASLLDRAMICRVMPNGKTKLLGYSRVLMPTAGEPSHIQAVARVNVTAGAVELITPSAILREVCRQKRLATSDFVQKFAGEHIRMVVLGDREFDNAGVQRHRYTQVQNRCVSMPIKAIVDDPRIDYSSRAFLFHKSS